MRSTGAPVRARLIGVSPAVGAQDEAATAQRQAAFAPPVGRKVDDACDWSGCARVPLALADVLPSSGFLAMLGR